VRILIASAIVLATVTIMALSSPSGAFGNETINYTYDAKGRLVKVEHSGSVNNNVQSNYTIDKADNRTNLNVTGAP